MENRIPARLHFVFLNKDEEFPLVFTDCFERVRKIHPGWEIIIYNEDDAQEILSKQLPALLPVYNSYSHVVQKSDILRVVLVYLFGGFYMDLDMFSFKSLEELRDYELVLGKERVLSDDELNHFEAKHKLRIGNYMFGGVPGHPFWLSFLKESITGARQKVNYENDIIRTTGPELLTNVYHSNKRKYKNITVLGNIDRRCTTSWHDAISCHFGNFAGHLHTGSWRWKGKERKQLIHQPVAQKDYQNAVTFLNTLLKEGDVAQDDCVVLRTNDRHLFMHENLVHLYKKCMAVYPVADDSKYLTDKLVLSFGDPRTYGNGINRENRNLLYTIPDEDQVTESWVASLNTLYHSCIVPHGYCKEMLIKRGVNIPVEVIPLGFERRLRNFAAEGNDEETAFTVAFSLTDNYQPVNEIMAACEAIRQSAIPGLQLKLIIDSNYTRPKRALTNRIRRSGYATVVDVSKMFARKFDNIHCFIFCDPGNYWSIGPREVLYEGIPAFLVSDPVYDELMRSGFYCVIESQRAHQQDDKEAMINGLKAGILKMYNNYAFYNDQAIEGSQWIEDKWTQEITLLEIYRMIRKISSQWQKKACQINY